MKPALTNRAPYTASWGLKFENWEHKVKVRINKVETYKLSK